MKKINMFKRAISAILVAVMLISKAPANTVVFASTATVGTNTSVTMLQNSNFKSTGGIGPAYTEEKVIFAITPYTLGSDSSSEGNILNSYIIGTENGKTYTKNDLIYQIDVEENDEWGYILKNTKQDHADKNGKKVYSGTFLSKYNNSYIPKFGNSQDILKEGDTSPNSNSKKITLGKVEVPFIGEDNVSYPIEGQAPVYLIDTLYPEYKYSFTHDQQYWANAGSSIFNTQPLQKSSLLFVSGDLIKYRFADYIWYTSNSLSNMKGSYTKLGFDSDDSNIIYGKYTYPNNSVEENAKPKAGLANGQSTNDIAKDYTSGGTKKATSGETLSTLFMKNEIKIENDGGVFYSWLEKQSIWSDDKTLDQVHVDKYYYDTKSKNFKMNNKLDDLKPAYKKVSVGPQINFDNLAKVPANLNALLKSNSTEAKNLTTEALKLWQYILYYNYYTKADVLHLGDDITIQEKVNDFLRLGCYQTVEKYKKNGSTLFFPTVDYNSDDFKVTIDGNRSILKELDSMFKESDSWDGFDKAAEDKFEFLTNLYASHYLDLLISAYVCAYNNDPNSQATKAWSDVLVSYCSPEKNNWSANNCSIQITPVTMAFGLVADRKEVKCVYTAAQDYVMLVYGIEEPGTVDEDSMASLNKAFFGYDANFVTTSITNSKTVKTKANTATSNKINFNGENIWVYESFYTKLKNCLTLNLKNGGSVTSYTNIDRIQSEGHFGASGTVNRVYKYLFSVNKSSKTVTESLSKNDWGKIGGGIGSLILSNKSSYTTNREFIKDINPKETVGSNLIIAYQWENLYQVASSKKNIGLSFVKNSKDNTNRDKMTVDLNKKAEKADDLDYTIQKDGSNTVVTLKTSTNLSSTIFKGVKASTIESANLNLGTQAYIKEIRIKDTKATDAELKKLLDAKGGLQLTGTVLDKKVLPKEDTTIEDVLYDYIRKKDSTALITNKDWITEAIPNRTEKGASLAGVGYYSNTISDVIDIVNSKIAVDDKVVKEQLTVAFGSNFKPSTKYEIDIGFKREAALGGKYKSGSKIDNDFDGITSNEIVLTLQYTPSIAEYKVVGYDIKTGYIVGWTDKKELTLGSETKEVFTNGKISFKEKLTNNEYTIAANSEALNSKRPSTLIYISDDQITNYDNLLKIASSKTEVVQKQTGNDQVFTFTADKASSYTYLLVPLDLASQNIMPITLNVYYSIKDGNIVSAEKVTTSTSPNKFNSEVTGDDGTTYKPITNEEYLTDDYKYECINPSANAKFEMSLIRLAGGTGNETDKTITYEDMLDNLNAKTMRRVGHNLDTTKLEWSVTKESDKTITSMLWIPVDSTQNDVPTTVYYVDEKKPTKVLKTDKKADAKKGYAYTTDITTEMFVDGMDYTVKNIEAYYTVTKTASKLKVYDTAKALSKVTVTNTDSKVNIEAVPSTNINVMAIYVLMEGKEPIIKESYISKPDAYAELKEGSIEYNAALNKNIFNETFEAMAGVPSTEALYFTTGGSEFIVQLAIESTREKAERKYETLFQDTDCQFKITDSLSGGTTGTVVTKQFAVNNTSGAKTATSIVPTAAEKYYMVNPVGASSYNTTFSAHNTASNEITATWIGTITNADGGAKPSDHKQAVSWNPGPSNNAYNDLCATETNSNAYAGNYGNPGSMGTERNNNYTWNVSSYNTALQQAYTWAKTLEGFSEGDGNITMLANSDGVTRSFHIGNAVIEIKLDNVSRSGENGSREVVNTQANGTWNGVTPATNTTSWESFKLNATNDARLGTTWREKYGAVATRGSSGGCVKSCWELAKYNQRPMNSVTYIGSYSGSGSNPVLSTYKDPDTPITDSEGNVTGSIPGASHTVYGIECSHAPVNTTFQYRNSWCGATSETHTAATHSKGSGGTDSSTPCSTTSGSHSVHTCTHSCGSWTPLVETEAVQMGTVNYTIKVSFKNTYTQADGSKYANETVSEAKKTVTNGILPAHALCGPCCNHHLPAIEDTWTQQFEFRTMKITAMKVWRLDSGYVTGMDEITDDNKETLIAEGEILQNLFYNIASTPTSAAGRLRYSLQTGQDDNVYWDEYTSAEKHIKERTSLCDGLGKTQSTYNPYTNGGKGHDEDYAYGCLYTSSNFANGIDTHKKDGALNVKYTNLVSDVRDRKTEEWQRFDMRRNLDVTVTVISDFLVLQSTSGDESICYHAASQTVKAQENPEELIKVQWSEIYTNNPLVRKGDDKKEDTGRTLNIGSYNGLYQLVNKMLPVTKYTGLGSGAKIPTRFDDNPVTTTANDGDREYYSGLYANRDLKEDGTSINLAEVKNKRTVIAGSGYISTPGRSETRLNRITKPILLSLNNIKQKVTNPNKEYETGQSYAFFEEILVYDKNGGYTWFYETEKDTVVNKNGYTMPSSYTTGQEKINNIVVHDPVSVVSARIIEPTIAKDQRVLSTSNSASLNEMFETAATCPGNPADCVNRILACTFFTQKTLAKFNIDNHDKQTEEGFERTYIIDTQNGIRILSSDSGYVIKEESGNSYLSTTGKAELSIDWSKVSLDTSSDLTSVSIAADITLSDVAETVIFSTQNAILKTLSSNKLQLELGNGDTYVSNISLNKNTKYSFELILSNGSLTEKLNYVKLNGTKVSFIQTVQGSKSVLKPYLRDVLVVGYDGTESTISAPKSIDNLTIIKLAGTTEHTDACYLYSGDGTKELICNDPHHQKDAAGNPLHYNYSSEVCYKACGNDQLHQESANTTDSTGQKITLANHIFLDNYFQVYYANKGDFAEAPTLQGISQTTKVKGMGYVNNMDTTKWLREKWVMFTFSILYYRESTGTWEQHEAGEYFKLDKEYEYYNFYCLLKNNEKSGAIVEFVSEAINNEELCTPDRVVKSQDCPSDNRWATNQERFSDKTAYHSAFKKYYIDLVGRIGNLIVEDTNDIRYTNLFKQSKGKGLWYVDGLLEQVDSNIQKNFLTWLSGTDIRGQRVASLIEKNIGFNTYGTLPWATGKESFTSAIKYTAGISSLPLSSDKNNVLSLSANNLKLGYKILWDVSTIGNYESGNVEVKPYVYALNTKTGVLTPVDVYMGSDAGYNAINYFGMYEETSAKQQELLSKLSNYALYLDWTESGRRNYTSAEQIATANVQAARKVPLYDINGNLVKREIIHPASDTREVFIGTEDDGTPIYEIQNEYVPEYIEEVISYRELVVPSGKYNLLGNLQLLSARETARTFIGSSKVSGVKINGVEETELINSKNEQWKYNEHGQRWHMYIGLPSNSVFVPYTDGTHYDPYTIKTDADGNNYYIKDEISADNEDYVFLLTVDITAFGETYSVHYDQDSNGTFKTTDKEGNTVIWNEDGRFDNLPTILAVYQGRSTVDITIKQTH